MKDFIPGLHDCSAEEYHALEAMSSGGMKKIVQSPAHFRLMRDTENTPTEQMRFGTATHTLVFEPGRADEIIQMPEFNARTKDGRAERDAWLAANPKAQAFGAEDYERLQATVAAVRTHAGAMELLSGGRPEVSLLWRDAKYQVPCKVRFDYLRDEAIVDLKTTTDASPEAFSRAIGRYLYHWQAAWYWAGYEAAFDASPKFFAFIAVESAPPHGVACYVLQEDNLRAGMRYVELAMRRYRECLDAGRWPGYPQEIQPISAPKYALTFSGE